VSSLFEPQLLFLFPILLLNFLLPFPLSHFSSDRLVYCLSFSPHARKTVFSGFFFLVLFYNAAASLAGVQRQIQCAFSCLTSALSSPQACCDPSPWSCAGAPFFFSPPRSAGNEVGVSGACFFFNNPAVCQPFAFCQVSLVPWPYHRSVIDPYGKAPGRFCP